MRPGLVRTTLRLLTWACVVLLAVLSLTPGEEIEPLRTDLPGQVEHIIAYAGSGAIAMAGYGLNRSPVRIIGWFWLYAGVLEYLQNFSPGRNPTWISQHRPLEPCAAEWPSSSSGVGTWLQWVRGIRRSDWVP
jgi:VanZ family protein